MQSTFEFVHGGKTSIKIDNGYLMISRKGFLNKAQGLKDEKGIKIDSITNIQLKKPGIMTGGSIKFGVIGNKDTLLTPGGTEILFSKKEMELALELKKTIETYLKNNTNGA
ncbi:hypothetical protein AWM68_20180 [Fictibacillus phosphorivorans]|uniref:Bacterial Pleckstrin homology domain-containing protein n=1 Tax=Fictibacillus phosphorivorans TaxID=1221500 RepID=A0A161RSD8_9BACL|nr:hypothetical protein [Fictibacillus phosphorivorans]KZE66845.1 hypothetical protein AWM68_20180 [Fictibacillus phosphorivorans]